MAITLGVGPAVAANDAAATTLVISLSGTTAGDTLVVGASALSGATISSVACSGESNLTLIDTQQAASLTTQLAYLANIATGGDKTITVTFSSSIEFRSGFALTLAGTHGPSVLDAHAKGTGYSTVPSVTVTPTLDNSAVVAIAALTDGAATGVAGSGYTLINIASTYTDGEYKLDAGAAGGKTVDFSPSQSEWAVSSAAFKVTQPGAYFDLPVVSLLAGNDGGIFNIPLLTLVAGDSGGAFSLPVLILERGVAALNLPVLTLSAAGSTGGMGLSAFPLPFITLEASGLTGGAGSAEFSLPVLTIEIVAQQNGLGDSAFSLPSLALVSNGETGGIGTAAFDLPVLTVVLAANQSIVGTAAFNLPVLVLSAQGAYTLAETYRTWVLNTRKGCLVEYSNFAFNSFALFNGQYLACGPGGVVVLGTQALDGATAITGRFRSGKSNFDSAWDKRVARLYMNFSCSGDMLFRTIISETGTRTYKLVSNKITTLQQKRVPIGRGPHSVYWQFEGENVSGSDFTVSSLMAYPTALRRRISG